MKFFDVATAGEEVLTGRSGTLGLISLNRPRIINSLSLGMVRAIDAALDDFEHDPTIAAVMVTGEGERGFCAGGDIKMLYEGGKAGSPEPATFWREEYRLNARIGSYPKPYVVLIEGITMGGGVGLSGHASHRITTETARLAMPETGIGFFPDVGATWLLSQAPGELGTYMGLTGEPVGATDAIAAGFADWLVDTSQVSEIAEALSSLPAAAGHNDVAAVIADAARPATALAFAEHRNLIDRCFAFDSIEEILATLAADASEFATKARATMLIRSPTSLKVTLALLRKGRSSPDLETCLEREFAATDQILRTPDFYEGIRAAIIDKDRNPKWSPATLDAVGPAIVDAFFRPHPEPLFG
ncbi:enoyl-CoA hydratase/isomerase family protein [Ciceribacter thiooxidans]|uniref:3-hydroxyisobutyryl-CoA hydrolase n=1 Tax=Ciceribacter thiooxidans TaxID=1969821 RepID=A0ABV7I633_9HYPH|nr:enoyl-CoA hydratase/isomerase family protein [Ciceribacter thiooxidans]